MKKNKNKLVAGGQGYGRKLFVMTLSGEEYYYIKKLREMSDVDRTSTRIFKRILSKQSINI